MTKKLHRALTEQKRSKESVKYKIYGTLGIPLGGQQVVEVATRPQYVYVRLRTNQSEVVQAFNNTVAPSYGLPVVVAREGNRYIILEVDTVRYANNWNNSASFLPNHGETHSFNDNGGGGDMVWVYSKQFMPMLVYPTGTFGGSSVFISPHMMLDTYSKWHYVGNTGTTNLLQYVPSGTQALMVLVYMDRNTGNPGYLVGSGSLFSNTLSASSDIAPFIPSPQPNQLPLAAIKVSTGTTTINWNYIYDVRQFNQFIATGSASGGGGGGGADTIGFAGLYNGVFLGTGTAMNVRSPSGQALFTISGTTFDLFITGSTGGTNPPVTGTFVVQNQGQTLGSVTTLNTKAPLFATVSGSVAQILISGTSSTYMRVGQPTSLSSVTGTYWIVPDRVYASGTLALFNQGHDLIPSIDYAEQYPVSGTFQYISTPPTGTYNLVIYGVPATGGGASNTSSNGTTFYDRRWVRGNAATAYDDEFNNGSLGGNWNRVDAGGGSGRATWTESGDSLSLYLTGGDASDEMHAMMEACTLSIGDTVQCYIRGFGESSNYPQGGLVLANGITYGSGKQAFMQYFLAGSLQYAIAADEWNGYNTRSGGLTYTASPFFGLEYHMRIKYSAANTFEFYASPDAISWRLLYTRTITLTPTYIGLAGSTFSGNTPFIWSFDYIRVNAP